MAFANNYKELEVYKLARELARKIFLLTKSFPKEETYSMTDQVRRSSRSVGAQIAEAWGKRLYVKHFVSKLTDADGEQMETQHWIEIAYDCNYIKANEASELIKEYEHLGRMLYSMMNKAELFCVKR
jgi:four helix bundle protein